MDFKIKLVIALLEDTKEMFIDRLYSMLFYEMFGIVVDADELHSRNQTPISDDILSKLDIVGKEIEIILEDCEIIDSVYNPTGLYKWAREISNSLGKHHTKTINISDESGNAAPKTVYSHYEQHDASTQVLMIVDNLNNLSPENQGGRLLTERETINMWSRTYCRLQITKHWKWSVINIIQQASDSEKLQFDFRGNSIIEKVKPSLDGLGNSKECQRDHFLVLGVFAPNRYGISSYSNYNIARLKDNFRSLIILKSNLSSTNIEIPYYFNGACSLLRELPDPSTINYDKPI